MKKILLLEDDKVLAESLIDLLEAEGFSVEYVETGEEVLNRTFTKSYDLFLFDVNVPDIDGFELLKSLRQSGDVTPTIFLNALSDIASLAQGFDVGADDYLKKPFEFDELLIRMYALIKRHSKQKDDIVEVDDFQYILSKNELYRKGEFIPLSPYEHNLVKIFFTNIKCTLSKEQLLEELSYERTSNDATLRVYINKLRKLSLPIQTIKGMGYRLGKS